jgi:hypothetical protein
MKELKRVEKVLDVALKHCCRGGVDWCGEIDRPCAAGSSRAIARRKNLRRSP